MAATPRLLALRAQLLAATGSDKQAEPLFGMAVQAATDNADALTVILPQLRRALDATAATAVLQPLTERDPTGLIRLHWGDSLIAAGRTHEGETALRTLSRNMPEHVEVRGRALLLIGNLCLTQHRAEVATLAFRDALQALPNHPVVLNNLATALLESPGAEREAVAVAQKALAATAGNTPLRAACLDTLGRAQHRLGLHQAASLSLEESLRIADTVRGRLLLARVFLAADAPGKAKESLIRARALAKGNTDNTALQEDILTTASELGIDIPAGNGQ